MVEIAEISLSYHVGYSVLLLHYGVTTQTVCIVSISHGYGTKPAPWFVLIT